MRFLRLFMILSLQCLVIIDAQRGVHPDNDPPEEPDHPVPFNEPVTEPGQNVGAPKANAPGAIAVGHNQYLAPEDEETDVGEIGETLAELLEKIKDLLDAAQSTTTSTDDSSSPVTITITTITATPTPDTIPTSAFPCGDALNFYDLCSSTYANFSALPATSEAGCLCNVYSAADFNSAMQGCYSYISNRTQYQSYTSAIANGTSLCAPSYMGLPMPSATPGPTTMPAVTSTSAPSTGAGNCNSFFNPYILLASVVGIALSMILY